MEKMTKVMYFEVIRGIVEGLGAEAFPEGVNADDVLDFIDRQVALLDKRAAASKERAAKKRAASDELTELIYTMIFEAEDFITADDIVEKIGDEEVTKNKVTARVSKLVKAGRVVKEQIKFAEGGKKRMAYRIAEEGEDVEADAE